jgi:hypothetical protein
MLIVGAWRGVVRLGEAGGGAAAAAAGAGVLRFSPERVPLSLPGSQGASGWVAPGPRGLSSEFREFARPHPNSRTLTHHHPQPPLERPSDACLCRRLSRHRLHLFPAPSALYTSLRDFPKPPVPCQAKSRGSRDHHLSTIAPTRFRPRKASSTSRKGALPSSPTALRISCLLARRRISATAQPCAIRHRQRLAGLFQ